MKRLVATRRGDIMTPHNYTRLWVAEGVRPVMQHIGIDVHKNSCQVCVLTEDGELIERRIKTDRDHISELLAARVGAGRHRVLDRERVGRPLPRRDRPGGRCRRPELFTHVATRSRRVKTDRRDARTLAEACRLGAYRPAHCISDRQRHVRVQLAARVVMVRTRPGTRL